MKEEIKRLAREFYEAAVKLEAAEQQGKPAIALANDAAAKRQAFQEAKCNTQS
jgi:hypothetical protein